MIKQKLFTALTGFCLGFLLSLSAVGCIVTGFDLAVNLWQVALWCGLGAAVSCICYSLPLGPVPLGLLTITGTMLWLAGDLKLSLQAVLYSLSRAYHSVHGWGVLRPLHYTADMLAPEVGLFLCFLGAAVAVCVCFTVCRRKNVLFALLPGLACLGCCFLVRQTVPDAVWLWCSLFGLLLLLLTNSARRADGLQGLRFTAIAALPLALFLLALFLLIPQRTYRADVLAQDLVDSILESQLAQTLLGEGAGQGNTGSSVDSGTVQLGSVGVRQPSKSEILQVDTEYSGILYLRGRALDTYDGLTWTDSGILTPQLDWPEGGALTSVGEVRIKTRFAHKMLYLPYYVQSVDLSQVNRGIENTKKLTEYSFSTALLREETELAKLQQTLGDTTAYIHLTEQVLSWAEPLAESITAGEQSVYLQARAIARYVRGLAAYDLNTGKMPSREKDFAQWFIEDGETGYCVHFATAATVLLQASGIPARYVTGYRTAVQENCVTVVRSEDAHAWVEYWLPGYGWTVLEVTPQGNTAPQEETQPQPQPTKPQAPIDGGKLALACALTLLAALTGLFLQSRVRVLLRRKRLCSGTLKRQILVHWQEVEQLATCLGESPGGALRHIAEKAKFSPHTPRSEELAPFRTYLQEARTRLKKHSLGKRLYYRLILALY